MGHDAGGGGPAEADELRAKLDDAERRLHSTALELRAALTKINNPGSPPRSPPSSRGAVVPPPSGTSSCPCGHAGATCIEHAGSHFWRSFVLAYMVRAGVAVVSRGLGLVRSGTPRDVFRFEKMIGERHVHYREEAVRLGMFLGSFTGGYHLVRCQLCRRLGFEPRRAAMLAGAFAGASGAFLKRSKRRQLALYLVARLAQSGYQSQKNAERFHFWGSDWNHGDALLFALSSAQVMYAYVFRPETLDRGFWNFVVRAGPIDKPTLGAVRANLAGHRVNLDKLPEYAELGLDGTGFAKLPSGGAFLPCVPCALMHRSTGCEGCARHSGAAAMDTFRKCFPFYLSIHLVPFAVLNAAKALRDPLGTVGKATLATTRSTAFISAFVGLYMGSICGWRRVFGGDHRAAYYAAGVVAAAALFIEKKSRRAELALYLMPRAVDSLVATMAGKKILPAVPHAELALLCVVSGGLMHLYENEPDTLAGFIRSTIRRFVHRPANVPLPHSTSEAMMQVLTEEEEDGGKRGKGKG